MSNNASFEVETQWVHLQYDENAAFTETYGFAGNQGAVNLEGIWMRPKGRDSSTLLLFMHPTSTLQLLPVPREAVRSGAHVLCAASRYAKNDTALIMEKVLLDLGAYVRHAREVWGYEKVVIVGWSGGGSLGLFYQSQAENPTITHTPAGDPVNIAGAGLIPADALIFQAAHLSRAQLLLDVIDPSVMDELNPDNRDKHLDIYHPTNTNQPPYSRQFIEEYRAAQLARVRRITGWVKETLEELKSRGTLEMERCFVTHRTLADPRFLDPSLDPNARKPRWCYMGNPETVNTGPVGLARFSTLRSWLSQWSIDDSRSDGLACARQIAAPLLVIENDADDAVPQPHTSMLFDAATTKDKTMHVIQGATHYYAGQPELLKTATSLIRGWLDERNLLGQ
ncbi:alpha/beta fold hydrolase [Paraburkholderia sp. LEh10]|uniref:alpha/beta hydrolase family protein n=1 Tax=Paraburkholderia sp. LEh10 TaxID=2821353 RepID=UPI001AE580FA|nr:alpha/beta fold hydrolase [Paraburkholderia sp. LEh10]MBP0590452.1 alpha/beta fold hydrolase [Paraburkholderia sp. LEh10]